MENKGPKIWILAHFILRYAHVKVLKYLFINIITISSEVGSHSFFVTPIYKNEQYICCLKTIESANTWQILRSPLPIPPPTVWKSYMYGP